MVPRALIPAEWLVEIQTLDRLPAIVLMGVAFSMLPLGLRYFRIYVTLGGALAGLYGGVLLGGLMHVTVWYVAVPSALMGAAMVWPVSRYVMPGPIAFVIGCGLASFLTYGISVANFWVGFPIGLVAGAALAFLADRFAKVIFFGVVGTVGVIAAVGPVVRASDGPFTIGGYMSYPLVFVAVGALLFIGSLVAQLTLDPEKEKH